MTQLHIPEPVASFLEAVNRHDPAAFAAAFSTDGVVDDWGRTFHGADEIARWSDKEFIGSRGTLRPDEVTVDAGTVVVTGDWRSTWANGRSRFEFAVHRGRIERMTIGGAK